MAHTSGYKQDNHMNREREYVLLAETSFYGLERSGATIEEICTLNKISFSEASVRFF